MKLLNRLNQLVLANEKRAKEIKGVSKRISTCASIPHFLRSKPPDKSQIEKDAKLENSKKQEESWEKVCGGTLKSWNPPVEELQATRKIPRRDEAEESGEGTRSQEEFDESLEAANPDETQIFGFI